MLWRLRYLLVSDMQLLAVQLQVILMPQVAKYNVRQGGSNTVSTLGNYLTVYLVVTKVYQVVPWVV